MCLDVCHRFNRYAKADISSTGLIHRRLHAKDIDFEYCRWLLIPDCTEKLEIGLAWLLHVDCCRHVRREGIARQYEDNDMRKVWLSWKGERKLIRRDGDKVSQTWPTR